VYITDIWKWTSYKLSCYYRSVNNYCK